ncbi:MAG: hypothetical protein ACTSP5_10950 [Candidatus Heimdallarchaeota archaeon]
MIQDKKKSFVKKIKETEKEIELESDSTPEVTEEERELDFAQLRVEDIQKADRVKTQTKIKGIERAKRLVEQPAKLTVSRTDNKYYASGAFDQSFMQMHTSEISYDLVQSELVRVGVITELVAEVNSGKEATIYTAHLKGSPLIVKAFRQQNTSHNRQKRQVTLKQELLPTQIGSTNSWGKHIEMVLEYQRLLCASTISLLCNS